MSELKREGPVAALESAAADLDSVTAEIDAVGADNVDQVVDAYDRFDDLLTRYRETATGSGREEFQAFVEFQRKLDDFSSSLPEDIRHRDAFDAAVDVLDRRRLEEGDFDRARAALEPVRAVAELIEDRAAARERLRRARHAVEARRREIDAEIDERRSVLVYDDVDFDAPTVTLREPIDAYDSAVDDAFRTYLSSASARDVVDFLEATRAYPLVDFPRMPDELSRYIRHRPGGEESIPTLLRWADYSRSKLDHYVSDPVAFRTKVASNRTYLDRLDATPLHVGWPPPPAETLRFRGRELVGVVERFAPADVVERLHAVRAVARKPEYPTLRRAAVARAELAADTLERLRDGSIHEEIESLRAERERLTRALEAHPDP